MKPMALAFGSRGPDSEAIGPTLVHVVRNAVDLGIEMPDQRAAHGKPSAGRVRLRTWQTQDSFCLEIEDDGAGIDGEALERSAREKGLLTEEADPLELIFVDGVSCKGEITDLSGRGVGLSAVREACSSEGGHVEVSTEPLRGTTFVFRFPRPVVHTGRLAEDVERRWTLLPLPTAPEEVTSATVIKVPGYKAS